MVKRKKGPAREHPYREMLQRVVASNLTRGGIQTLVQRRGAKVAGSSLVLLDDAATVDVFLGMTLEDVMKLPGAMIVVETFCGNTRRAVKVPLDSLPTSAMTR